MRVEIVAVGTELLLDRFPTRTLSGSESTSPLTASPRSSTSTWATITNGFFWRFARHSRAATR